jgi:hypothetical protein
VGLLDRYVSTGRGRLVHRRKTKEKEENSARQRLILADSPLSVNVHVLTLYGFGGGLNNSQCSTHFTVLASTVAFLWPEKSMSGRISSVCVPLATLKVQLKLIDWTPPLVRTVSDKQMP